MDAKYKLISCLVVCPFPKIPHYIYASIPKPENNPKHFWPRVIWLGDAQSVPRRPASLLTLLLSPLKRRQAPQCEREYTREKNWGSTQMGHVCLPFLSKWGISNNWGRSGFPNAQKRYISEIIAEPTWKFLFRLVLCTCTLKQYQAILCSNFPNSAYPWFHFTWFRLLSQLQSKNIKWKFL